MDDKDMDLLIALVGADNHWLSQLVAYRKLKGLTQAEVAGKMGIKQSNVSRLENLNSGKRRQHSDLLTRYAEAIGVYVGHIAVDSDADYQALDRKIGRHLRDLHRAVRTQNRPKEGSTPEEAAELAEAKKQETDQHILTAVAWGSPRTERIRSRETVSTSRLIKPALGPAIDSMLAPIHAMTFFTQRVDWVSDDETTRAYNSPTTEKGTGHRDLALQ